MAHSHGGCGNRGRFHQKLVWGNSVLGRVRKRGDTESTGGSLVYWVAESRGESVMTGHSYEDRQSALPGYRPKTGELEQQGAKCENIVGKSNSENKGGT